MFFLHTFTFSLYPLQASMRFIQGLEQALSSMEDLKGVFAFVEAVHSPYCQLLVKYPTMETQLLKHQLHTLQVVRRDYYLSQYPFLPLLSPTLSLLPTLPYSLPPFFPTTTPPPMSMYVSV